MTHGGGEDAGEDLAPISKAAILLLAMGEDEAAKVLRHLEPKEVQRVGAALSALAHVDSRQLDSVVNHFLETVSGVAGRTMSANDYLRSMLVGAFGEQRARSLLERVVEANMGGLDKLRWMDSRAIADFVLREQLQIQAVVLSYLPSHQAAEVLGYFPDDVARSEVLVRMVSLVPVPPGAVQVLSLAFETRAGREIGRPPAALRGTEAAALILNHLDEGSASRVMAHIVRHDTALAAEIHARMLVLRDGERGGHGEEDQG